MYKRQNTSVAYQAPEGKTYVSDLRDVYDFHFGQSKVVKNNNASKKQFRTLNQAVVYVPLFAY